MNMYQLAYDVPERYFPKSRLHSAGDPQVWRWREFPQGSSACLDSGEDVELSALNGCLYGVYMVFIGCLW